MTKEQIKKDLRNVADLRTGSFEGEDVFNQGGNYILDTYYTPLEESHRELVEVLQKYVDCDDLYNEEDCRAARTALSNAKKLINERP